MSIFFYTHYILLFLIQSQATDPGGRTKGMAKCDNIAILMEYFNVKKEKTLVYNGS